MHEIDGSFSKQRTRKLEQQKKRQRRVQAIVVAACLLATTGALFIGQWLDRSVMIEDQDDELVQQQIEEALVPVYVPVIIDLPGDPIHIELGGAGTNSRPRQAPVPPTLLALGVSGTISVALANVVESGQRLAFALPSTQQDFAFFQSQRAAVQQRSVASSGSGEEVAQGSQSVLPVTSQGDTDPNSNGQQQVGGGDWEDIGSAGVEGADIGYESTAVENNTSTLILTAEQFRAPATEDLFIRVTSDVAGERFFVENNINLVDAKKAAASLSRALGTETLAAGSFIAMRQLRTGDQRAARKLVQIALYQTEKFITAFALGPDNSFYTAADPWANQRLLRSVETAQQAAPQVQNRLLDSIFSAALRQGIPASIVGEAIMYLSRQYDLSDLAAADDKIAIVFTDKPREGGTSDGRILYISLRHKGKTLQCFVYKPEGANDYKCYDDKDVFAEIEVSNGIVVPVAGGVLTSGFGPRQHPILKKVLLHNGVDWAAPIGTPVLAAMDGIVSFAADGGTYGNLIKITHQGGKETRYAHLDSFSKSIAVGQNVTAGDTIGYIGTTGRSTGPHLHFELYAGGQPTDPLASSVQSVTAFTGSSDAVSQLVNRIVQVESGGSATAKNPLSSATGLGQFIDSTWLRMLRSYRPDLANSLSKEKLLALRFDPTLSREMVGNLANENRAYLSSSGIQISAGRLYLAHFLGPEGARLVLSSDDYADLGLLLGQSVINANPFLRGKDVAYLKDWGERKMKGRGYIAQPQKPVISKQSVERASPAFERFRQALISLAGSV